MEKAAVAASATPLRLRASARTTLLLTPITPPSVIFVNARLNPQAGAELSGRVKS
jgi:hypothetical protein